jgi:hypothetical protein
MRQIFPVLGIVVFWTAGPLFGLADCNRNQASDLEDVASGISLDCNANDVPDECELSLQLGLGDSLPIDGTAQAVAVGDFDGDHQPDLVLACDHDDAPARLQLLLAAPSPAQFSAPVILTRVSDPEDLQAVDLDGDARLDILASDEEGLLLLRNLGGATFAPAVTIEDSSEVDAIIIADLEGDGLADLIYAQPAVGRVVLRRNLGPAGLGAASHHPVPVDATHIAIADLDSDGLLDLAVTGDDKAGLVLLLAQDDGEYAPSVRLTIPSKTTGIQAADANGDLTLDLFVSTEDGVFLLTNDGQANLSPPRSLVGDNQGAHASDLDGDGDPDVALFLGRTQELCVLVNSGDGQFEPTVRLATASRAQTLFVDDFDGNGTPDLLVPTPNGLNFFWNSRHDTFSLTRQTVPVTRRPHGGILADLNLDGLPDVVLSSGHNRAVTVHFSIGDGTIGPEVNYTQEEAGHLNSITAADIDSDGDVDVIVADKELNHFSVFRNTGNGTLDEPSHYAAGRGAFHLTAGDLDGDGHVDLVSANEDGANVTLAFNQGDGTFADQQDVRVGNRPVFVSAADLDGDGDLELAVANDTSQSLTIVFNDGDRSFDRSREYPVLKQCLTARPVDLDRDGDLDLITANGTEDVVGLFWNDGRGSLEQEGVPTPLPPQDALAEDVNGDGELDLIVLHKASSAISLLLGHGGGTFGPGSVFSVGELPRVVLAGDLDLDGDVDIVAANRISKDVTVFENRRASPISAIALAQICADDEVHLPTTPDFRRGDANSDGHTNIADASFILGFLFGPGPEAACPKSADVDDSGDVLITDPVALLSFLFLGDEPPAAPYLSCGKDTTLDSLACEQHGACARQEVSVSAR